MSDFVEIEKVNEGAKIISMEFRHVCGCLLDPRPAGQINATRISVICEQACPKCGDYSGFDFFRNDRRPIPGEPGRAQREQNQNHLRVLIPAFVTQPTAERRQMIQELLKNGRLRLSFKIRP